MNNELYFTAYQLSDFKIASLPKTPVGIRLRAEKENWLFRERTEKGGGFEYSLSNFTAEVQAEILSKTSLNASGKNIKLVEKKEQDQEDLNASRVFEVKGGIGQENVKIRGRFTKRQQECALARLHLVGFIRDLRTLKPYRKKKDAINYVLNNYNNGLASEDLQYIVEKSNYKVNNAKNALSYRSIENFIKATDAFQKFEDKLLALTPKSSKKNLSPFEVPYMTEFLEIYCTPQGLSFAEAHRQLQEYVKKIEPNYTILSVNRFKTHFNKLPLKVKLKNRVTGGALNEKLDFVRRDWQALLPNDCWVGDGHAMKLKVEHPIHGRPFTPELTLIIDTASRKVMGWSLTLAESGNAIKEALRNGIEHYGVPAIYYSDNGGGQKNDMLDDPAHGLLLTLGIKHATGIAGNPQGRGIIERLNKSLALKIAQKFPTYYGTGADPVNVNKTLRAVNSYDNAVRKGKQDLTNLAKFGEGKLPKWAKLIKQIQISIDEYNNTEHSIIRMSPNEYYEKFKETKAEEQERVKNEILDWLFMPTEIRKTQRGEVVLFNNIYYHRHLLEFGGQEVVVGYDVANPSYVVVKEKKSGKFICRAKLDGNKVDAFPKEFVDKARTQREKRRLANIENKRQEILEEARGGLIEQQQAEGFELLKGFNNINTNEYKHAEMVEFEDVENIEDEQPIFMFEVDRQRWLEQQAKKANGV